MLPLFYRYTKLVMPIVWNILTYMYLKYSNFVFSFRFLSHVLTKRQKHFRQCCFQQSFLSLDHLVVRTILFVLIYFGNSKPLHQKYHWPFVQIYMLLLFVCLFVFNGIVLVGDVCLFVLLVCLICLFLFCAYRLVFATFFLYVSFWC